MTDTMPLAAAHDLLRRAFAQRAAFYGHMLDVLTDEFGRAQAIALMQRATHRMGAAMGRALAGHDLAGLRDAFLGGVIEAEALFAPDTLRCDGEELVMHFHRCPLKEAWQAEGRSADDQRDLCTVAGAVDAGLFTAAGFSFRNETWQPGGEGCCTLRIRPGS